MYGDPNVMEELRERLPRAGKSDIKEQWTAVQPDNAPVNLIVVLA